MLDDFLVRAALAGLGVALAAAPLGCFVVWRRMAYFGEATAHAAILGVALALAFDAPVFGGTMVAAICMALGMFALSNRGFASDTLLGVLGHATLALGLVTAAFLNGVRIDLNAFLFGDILAVTRFDVLRIWLGGAVVLGVMFWRWHRMLTSTLSPDLAHAAGINPRREDLLLTLMLAIVVALTIKVVGVLLTGALLIIPAASARAFASTPERMALVASGLGGVSVLSGLQMSLQFDTPTGPTIVCAATAVFILSVILNGARRSGQRS